MNLRKIISESIWQGGECVLPYLTEVQNPSKKYTVSFRGINYGEGTQDGEFSDTYNLSTDQYPCITQRAARLKAKEYTKPTTLHAKGKLLVIDERLDENGEPTGLADVYYDDSIVGEVSAGKKQTATIGNYIVIFPDKKYYKVPTEDDKDGEFGSMEVEYKMKGLKFTASAISIKKDYECSWLEFTSSTIKIGTDLTTKGYTITEQSRINLGSNVRIPFVAGEVVTISGCRDSVNNKTLSVQKVEGQSIFFAPLSLQNGSYFAYETNSTITISRVATDKFFFGEDDTVTISGCSQSENNKELVIKSVTDHELTFDDDTFIEATEVGKITITRKAKEFSFEKGDSVTITGCSKNENNKETEIIIRGATADELTFDSNTFTEADEQQEVTISRTVPPLDFICESNYRLWGTHENTIYSSKFSDPLNFKSFEGLAGDSYSIDVASEGEFTGCIPFSSHICFFKENTLHKLYGTKPSNFQITTSNVYGVQSGSERSMHIVNEQLIYKGVGGVYAYTGGVPELISENFGTKRYSDAVACCDGEKYYISMKQGDNRNMFVYDVAKNIWLREDDTHAVDMTFYDGKVYYLDARGELYYIDKTADRGDIEWGATFCTMHETMNERKGYSKFHLRMDLSAGAWLAVDIKTDNDLQWKQVYTTHNEKAKTVSIPITPTRCDSIDIRLRGKGRCTVKTFVREFAVGSDV